MSYQHDDDDIVKCTWGANVISHRMSEHITKGIHNKNLKLKKNDTVFNPTITIENITFNNCPTCQVYIDSRQYNNHLTSYCIYTTVSLPLNYFKGRMKCICNQVLKNENKLH